MIHAIYILPMIYTLAACGTPIKEGSKLWSSSKTSSEGEQLTGPSGEDASTPERITGTYLVCMPSDDQVLRNQEKVSCRIEQDRKKVILSAASNDETKWQSGDLPADIAVSTTTEGTDSPWHVTYTYSSENNIDNSRILESSISVTYFDEDLGSTVTLSSKIIDVLESLNGVKKARFHFDSIRGGVGQGAGTIRKIEFKISGVWYRGKADMAVGEVKIGDFPAKFQGMPADLLMFASIFGYDSQGPLLPGSYASESPYDLLPGNSVYLEVQFDQPEAIEGIRLNNGEPFSLDEGGGSIPDKYHVETSEDGINWSYRPGSDISLSEFQSVIDFKWSK